MRSAARVISVNTGRPQERAWAALGRTSIDKTSQPDAVWVERTGLVGDQVSDTRHHGGPDQAVYAFAREDLDAWGEELGSPLRNGHFGENLTTEGIDLNAAEIGERWRVGTTLLEVRKVRVPCNDFKAWLGVEGFDNKAWVRRFAQLGRPGPYLRVLEEGTIRAGDPIDVVHRPGHGLTVSDMFRALHGDTALLARLLGIDDLADSVRVKARGALVRRASGPVTVGLS